MPLSVPAISRREFLRRAALTGAACALPWRDLLAESAAPAGDVFALLSDTHINADAARMASGQVMSANLRAAIADVLTKKPARVLVNGDCAHLSGEAEDYTQFLTHIAPIVEAGLPLDLALGNHDNREHFLKAFRGVALAASPVEHKHVAIIEGRHANWFLLDSLDQVNKTPGLIGEKQLGWLARELDARERATPGKPAIVMAHHTLNGATGNPIGLADTGPFLDLLASKPQVKAYVHGHSHAWGLGEHKGVHLINLPATAYVFSDQQTMAWVLATTSAQGMRLELQPLDKAHAWAGQAKELTWRS